MKNTLTSALAILFAASLSQAASANEKEPFKMIHVQDLVTLMEKNSKPVTVYDVNTADTRKSDGVIPGAKLLSSSKKYDVKKELPADKDSTLVFYCANTECMASHAAASRAVEKGYKDVSVMADGIQGWKKSGQKTQMLN